MHLKIEAASTVDQNYEGIRKLVVYGIRELVVLSALFTTYINESLLCHKLINVLIFYLFKLGTSPTNQSTLQGPLGMHNSCQKTVIVLGPEIFQVKFRCWDSDSNPVLCPSPSS